MFVEALQGLLPTRSWQDAVELPQSLAGGQPVWNDTVDLLLCDVTLVMENVTVQVQPPLPFPILVSLLEWIDFCVTGV